MVASLSLENEKLNEQVTAVSRLSREEESQFSAFTGITGLTPKPMDDTLSCVTLDNNLEPKNFQSLAKRTIPQSHVLSGRVPSASSKANFTNCLSQSSKGSRT